VGVGARLGGVHTKLSNACKENYWWELVIELTRGSTVLATIPVGVRARAGSNTRLNSPCEAQYQWGGMARIDLRLCRPCETQYRWGVRAGPYPRLKETLQPV